MRNITVTVDDETYTKARVRAAELDTSVSALVRDYLRELATEESEFDRLARGEHEIRMRIHGFSASERLTRKQLYDEAV